MSDSATGSKLQYINFTAKLISISGVDMTRDSVNKTTIDNDSGWMDFTPSTLVDPGQVSCVVEYDLTTVNTIPPIDAAPSILYITYGTHRVSNLWYAYAYLTAWSTGAAIGTRLTATATFKLTGAITIAST
jgi:hypothetical protein